MVTQQLYNVSHPETNPIKSQSKQLSSEINASNICHPMTRVLRVRRPVTDRESCRDRSRVAHHEELHGSHGITTAAYSLHC